MGFPAFKLNFFFAFSAYSTTHLVIVKHRVCSTECVIFKITHFRQNSSQFQTIEIAYFHNVLRWNIIWIFNWLEICIFKRVCKAKLCIFSLLVIINRPKIDAKQIPRLQNNLQQYNEVLFREILKTSYITLQTNVFRARGNNLNLLLWMFERTIIFNGSQLVKSL